MRFDLAVNETLAEMAAINGERRIGYRGIDTPKPSQAQMNTNARLYRDLYRAIDKVFKS